MAVPQRDQSKLWMAWDSYEKVKKGGISRGTVLSAGKINSIHDSMVGCFLLDIPQQIWNIIFFIMNGKTWWQNSEEKSLKEIAENLKNYSYV
jgi:hypothetical protein